MEAVHSPKDGSLGAPKGRDREGGAARAIPSPMGQCRQGQSWCAVWEREFFSRASPACSNRPEKPSQPPRSSTGQSSQIQKTTRKEYFPKINGKSATMMILFPISYPLPHPFYVPPPPIPCPQTELIIPEGSVVYSHQNCRQERRVLYIFPVFFCIETCLKYLWYFEFLDWGSFKIFADLSL